MKPVRTLIRLIAVACLGGWLPSVAIAQTIVWTDGNARKIQRKDVNGGVVQTIIQFPLLQGADQIHYEPIGKKFYYLFYPNESGTSIFQRCNLDGTNPEDVPTPSLGTFALNIAARKLYWRNSNILYRSELDGTGVESHAYGNCCIFSLEPVGNMLFFGAGGGFPKGIWRADADGSNEELLHQTANPTDLAFDPIENKVYMGALNDIVRINTDGSDFEMILQGLTDDVAHLEVDYRGRKLYWVEHQNKVIRRSNLDGTNIEDFVTAFDVGNPNFYLGGLTFVDSRTIPTVSELGVVITGLTILVAGFAILKKRMLQQRELLY